MNRIEHFVFTSLFLALICPNNLYAQVASGTLNGHDYVDLGLSVKWATCNVGASSPYDYGNYYAWGETNTKWTYTYENSKTLGKSGYVDIAGDSRYDAARANWGGTWRMPTMEELKELEVKCTWTWTTQDDHNGYRVTGPNGNSIFLIAAGFRDESPYNVDLACHYWSSTPFERNSNGAYFLVYYYDSMHNVSWSYRPIGRPVRPVTE